MVITTASLAGGAQAADTGTFPSIDFKGLLDLRGVVSSDTQSGEDGGLGKTRYGASTDGDRRVLGQVGEAALLIEPHFTWDISSVVMLNVTQEQRTVVDVTEAYLQYKPAPTGGWGVSGRAGVFFPPISLENTGLAWTSPYTITPSAINSWVGQELRTIGGEAAISHRSTDLEITGTVAIYGYNDPAGTLLAWRGWDFDDRITGLFDRLKLPQPNGTSAGTPYDENPFNYYGQAPYDRPFHEIDGRVGYYGNLSIDYAGYGKVSVMRYDNRGDNRVFGDNEWAWSTSFWSFGLSTQLGDGIDLLAQGMTGTTSLITTPAGPLVDVNFRSAYALVSKSWDNQRISFRTDWFDTKDRNVDADEYGENGYALTLAYILRPRPKQRLTIEFLYVDSHRPERQYQGVPVNARETQFQASYRFFL